RSRPARDRAAGSTAPRRYRADGPGSRRRRWWPVDPRSSGLGVLVACGTGRRRGLQLLLLRGLLLRHLVLEPGERVVGGRQRAARSGELGELGIELGDRGRFLAAYGSIDLGRDRLGVDPVLGDL